VSWYVHREKHQTICGHDRRLRGVSHEFDQFGRTTCRLVGRLDSDSNILLCTGIVFVVRLLDMHDRADGDPFGPGGHLPRPGADL